MASSKQLFRTKSPKHELVSSHAPKKAGKKIGKSSSAKAEIGEYTFASKGEMHHISPKSMQRLKLMGCPPEYVSDLLHTMNVLENFSNRTIDPPVFQEIKERYHLGMGTMASLASITNLRLSDMGVDLRGLARFYSRNRADIGDVEELEKFINWVSSRGESVKGVPSAWNYYKALHKPKTKRARKVRRRSTKSRIKKLSKKRVKRSSKKTKSSRSKSKKSRSTKKRKR